MSVIDLGPARVFRDPTFDLGARGDAASWPRTDPAPDGYLAFVASRPKITAGTPTDTTFAGYPARSMTYTAGTVKRASSCVPDNPTPCLR